MAEVLRIKAELVRLAGDLGAAPAAEEHLISPPPLRSRSTEPEETPVRFPFSQGIPRSIATSHAMRSPGPRGDEARQSDNVRLEGEASRFRWLRAPATTDIALHIRMTGISAKVLSATLLR